MPCFHFHLRTQGALYPDPDGSECRNLAEVRLHAERVATELMRNAAEERRLWSLRVEDWDGRHVFDVLFADVWQNVGRPSPERTKDKFAVSRPGRCSPSTSPDRMTPPDELHRMTCEYVAQARPVAASLPTDQTVNSAQGDPKVVRG